MQHAHLPLAHRALDAAAGSLAQALAARHPTDRDRHRIDAERSIHELAAVVRALRRQAAVLRTAPAAAEVRAEIRDAAEALRTTS